VVRETAAKPAYGKKKKRYHVSPLPCELGCRSRLVTDRRVLRTPQRQEGREPVLAHRMSPRAEPYAVPLRLRRFPPQQVRASLSLTRITCHLHTHAR
jgi:hypothetical protein